MAADDLERVRTSLLRGLRVSLGPGDGDEAFERHILLAVRIHRAAGLNQTVKGEGAGWVEFMQEHFPKRPTWRDDDALQLWEDWRIGLVKHETPFRRVTVTHGQPEAHWHRELDGAICIDLESMWDDFESAVKSFIALLRDESARAEVVASRWRERSWTVRPLRFAATQRFVNSTLSASAAGMPTTMGGYPPPAPHRSALPGWIGEFTRDAQRRAIDVPELVKKTRPKPES